MYIVHFNFACHIQGFDQTINLILDETHERVYSAGQGVEQVQYDQWYVDMFDDDLHDDDARLCWVST